MMVRLNKINARKASRNDGSDKGLSEETTTGVLRLAEMKRMGL